MNRGDLVEEGRVVHDEAIIRREGEEEVNDTGDEDNEEVEDDDSSEASYDSDGERGMSLGHALKRVIHGEIFGSSVSLDLTLGNTFPPEKRNEYLDWVTNGLCVCNVDHLRITFLVHPDLEALARILWKMDNSVRFETDNSVRFETDYERTQESVEASPRTDTKVRVELEVKGIDYDATQESVEAFARTIESRTCITAFKTYETFPLRFFGALTSALGTLPNMSKVMLWSHCESEEEEGQPFTITPIFRAPYLQEVEFHQFNFTETPCQDVALALGGETLVTSLEIDDCSFQGDSSCLADALVENTSLTRLIVSDCVFDQDAEFYQSLAKALAVNNTIADLMFSVPTGTSCSVLSPVFRAFEINKGVKTLTVYNLQLCDSTWSSAIRAGLQHNTTLQRLSLNRTYVGEADPPLWQAACSFLETNTNLDQLDIWFVGEEPAVVTTFVETLSSLKGNCNVKTLTVEFEHNLTPTILAAGILALGSNTTLTALNLFHGNHPWSDDDEVEEFFSAARSNYGLESLGLRVSHRAPKLEIILRLNQAGRQYLLEDAPLISAGVDVLSAVADDLDCLYFHLRENPMLCERGRTATSKKRKNAPGTH